ncbi:f-box/tpr repeat protein pof3 [Holotrichia oblita]|uniref:F-box/tpr repeat protein pof3 n=1 Tax=Holotrichia oblita TaxID=644536 RepID=A0ACB9T0H2_HOLOL|nr:f-box/tpr repeat protein pof3 [Holotrichia oblita]
MAGKMLEPDSNTREIHLNSIAETLHGNKSSSYLDNSNCYETNGEVKFSDCDVLPNNNLCEKRVSQFYSDSENDSMTSVIKTVSNSNTTAGESTSDEALHLNESGTHLLQNSEYFNRSDKDDPKADYSIVKPIKTVTQFLNWTEHRLPQTLAMESNTVELKRVEDELTRGSSRGRPKKFMYHSQISGDKDTIKIRIKKSNLTTQLTPNKKKLGRRKRNKNVSDTDASDYESPSKRARASLETQNNTGDKDNQEPDEQSVWGHSIPTPILHKIFQHLCLQEGSLPMLIRLSKVCKLWRNVSLSPSLWQKVDLNWVRERFERIKN